MNNGVAQLSHIKTTTEDGREPWEPSPPEPSARRIAWPGGKIVSNKDEALIAFLKRKQARGEPLAPAQLAALETAAKGTCLEGKTETYLSPADGMDVEPPPAAAEQYSVSYAEPSSSSAASGGKRKASFQHAGGGSARFERPRKTTQRDTKGNISLAQRLDSSLASGR